MLGWLRAARARASRSNRASHSGRVRKAAGRIFSATSRPNLLSRARYTSPIPPTPRTVVMRYAPSCVPAGSVTWSEGGCVEAGLETRLPLVVPAAAAAATASTGTAACATAARRFNVVGNLLAACRRFRTALLFCARPGQEVGHRVVAFVAPV